MKVVPLGELCHIKIGRTPSRANPDYWGGPHPWATISDLAYGPLSTTKEGVTDLAVQEARLQPVAPGTLLYSFKLTIGKMAVASTPLFTNEAIAALIPRDPRALDSEYLRYALATVNANAGASTAVKGRTLNSESLASLPVPLVPIEVQRRMAAHLAAQLATVDDARSAGLTIEAVGHELHQSAIASAFAGPSSRQGFARLEDIASLIRGVSFDGDESSPSVGPNLRPILRAGNITDRLVLDRDLVWVPDSRVSNDQRMRCGDIAICMSSGSASVVGKSALLEADFDGSVGAFCAIIRPTGQVRPGFLATWLRSPAFMAWRDGQSRGANIQNLKLSSLGQIELPLPELPAQDSAMQVLGERLEMLRSMNHAIGIEFEAIKALPAGLLREAFALNAS